jgi:soluble lytic murein transglycosylase-like protein
MRHVSLGDARYRLVATDRDGQFFAHAVRDDNGDPFGVECSGATEAAAIERLTRWLEWQHEHAAALEALQHAERAYHRTIAGSAFASPTEGPSALEMQKESLDAVEAARVRLDDIRTRKPE